eukprot:7680657-Pyramimonas_sp.AAC.1
MRQSSARCCRPPRLRGVASESAWCRSRPASLRPSASSPFQPSLIIAQASSGFISSDNKDPVILP